MPRQCRTVVALIDGVQAALQIDLVDFITNLSPGLILGFHIGS